MAKPAEEIEDISQVEVKLKPLLGIKPGVYLTAVYGLVVLLVLFLLLFLPGIRKNGTRYTFESVPGDAAVYVDGSYAGSTPTRAFVEKGSHAITFSRPHFQTFEKTVETKGRIFGSLFAPRTSLLFSDLTLNDPEQLLLERMKEISEWGLINQFGPSYQPPRLISSTVSDYYEAGAQDSELLDDFLESLLPGMNGEVFLADYLRGLFLRESFGKIPSADTALRVIRRVASLNTRFPGLPLLITAAFPQEQTAAYNSSDWFEGVVARYRAKIDEYSTAPKSDNYDERMIAGMPFVLVPAGNFVMGMPIGNTASGDLPHPESTKEFYMLKGEVSRLWFSNFIEENPEWGPDGRDALVASGLVDEEYLSDWDDQSDQTLPVTFVSWHAAVAFAEWFGNSLPAAWQGFAAKLSTESEWEWASLLFSTEKEKSGSIQAEGPVGIEGRSGVEHLQGNLWEWCDTWFHPADYFAKTWDPTSADEGGIFDIGAEAVVRGGSWANTAEDRVTTVSRGSQPPDWCTPFTGFRIVLIRK